MELNIETGQTVQQEDKNPFLKATKKKVAICGTAPTVRHAPFNNDEFDIWGVAHCTFLMDVTRMDVIFEIHKKEIYDKDNAPFHRFPNALLYLPELDAKFPNAKKFPLKEILDKYKVNEGFDNARSYMSSSIPYMICMAIEAGYEEIHMYGIHLLMEEEYFFQRPCVEYYLGLAQGKGIKVFIADGADILSFGYLYGYQEKETEPEIAYLKESIDEFDKRLQTIQQQAIILDNEYKSRRQQIENNIQQLVGARERDIHHMRRRGKEIREKSYVKF
jgi:hypothetical protein